MSLDAGDLQSIATAGEWVTVTASVEAAANVEVGVSLNSNIVGSVPKDQEATILGGIIVTADVVGALVSLAVYNDKDCTDLAETLIAEVAVDFSTLVEKTWAEIAGAAVTWIPDTVKTYYIKGKIVDGTPVVNETTEIEAILCIWDVVPTPTNLTVIDDETGDSLTAEADLDDESLWLRFYYGIEFNDDWIGYVELPSAGSGSVVIPNLTSWQRYQVSAVAVFKYFDGVLMSAPTIPVLKTPTLNQVQNTDERKHMSKFIQHLMRDAVHYRWYRKSVDQNTIPSKMVNVPFSADPASVNIQFNENVSVLKQPNIFQERGVIPIVKQRTRGFNKADIGFGDVKFGDFTGFCAIEHEVEIDDRVINTRTGQEFKIVHSTPHETGLYRHLELKWLR